MTTGGSTEDLVIVESKDYAQVVFDEVKECFIENQPLECLFTLNDLLKADASDSIGIYKVGFSNCKDYVCSQLINLESIVESKGKITFSGEQLPKDDGEFYQFVYVSQSKQIRGASVPFQFKRTHLSDYIEVEEQEAVVIKSKESAINDTITEIKSRCIHLAHANDTYEKLVKENEDLIQVLKEEVSSVKMRCLKLTMDNEKLNHALKTKADSLKNLAETITNLTNENNKLQNKFETLTSENKNLLDSLEHRIDQVAQLRSDLETVKMSKGELETILNIKENELNQLKRDKDELNRIAEDLQRINEQIVKLEKQVDDRVEELTNIKNELKKNEALVSEQAVTIQNILIEKDSLNSLIQKLTKEKCDLELNQDNLHQELNMSKDKLLAAEQCKEMLRAQLVVVTDELNESNKKVDCYLETIKQLMNKEKQFEYEKSEMVEKMEKMRDEYEFKLQETNGSYFALRLAHTHLETRLKASLEQKKEKTEKEFEEHKLKMEKLEEENNELKERISAGAKEYSKLFEKYRLLRNQQFNYDMNIYHDLNGDIHFKKDINNTLCQRLQYRHSTPSEEPDVDSAIQDRTVSQSVRASSTDIENTLLDALLGSSFNNNGVWNFGNQRAVAADSNQLNQLNSIQQQLTQLNLAHQTIGLQQKQNICSTTTTQPAKIINYSNSNLQMNQSNDVSDDGLINLNSASSALNAANANNIIEMNESSNLNNRTLVPSSTSTFFDDSKSSGINVLNRVCSATNINQTASVNRQYTAAAASNLIDINSSRDGDDNVFKLDEKQSQQQPNILRLFENRRNNSQDEEQTNYEVSNMRTCDICNYIFPTDSNINEVEKHYAIHYGPSCPVCFLVFRKGYPQDEFENHVQTHFSN